MAKPADRRRARTLSALLDEALQIVREQGLDGLTMASLAERMDYTTPALYRYFPSKGVLIAELNRRVIADVRTALSEAWAEAEDPLAAVSATAEVLYALATERPAAFGLVTLSLADPRFEIEEARPAHAPELEAMVMALSAHLAEAEAAGQISSGDPAERALRLLFGVLGTLQLRTLERFEARIDTRGVVLGLAKDLIAGWQEEHP